MTGLRHRLLIALAGSLAILLLLAEYWLLQDDARQRGQERQRLWGQFSLSNLDLRLQSALDSAQLLLPPAGTADPLAPEALDSIVRKAIHPEGLFDSVAIVQETLPPRTEASLPRPVSGQTSYRLSPAAAARHFPVTRYFSDHAESIPLGVDLGSTPENKKIFDLARDSRRPLLASFAERQRNHSRTMVVSWIPDTRNFLLLGINKEQFLNLRLPDGSKLLREQRLIVWAQNSQMPPMLLFDSQAEQASPTGTPSSHVTSRIGSMEIQYGTYSIRPPADRTGKSNEPALLLLSACGTLMLLVMLYWLACCNHRFKHQLSRKNQQLALKNQALRQQISERIHSEHARTDSEMRQRAILQAGADAILLLDHTGTISDVNPSATRLIGQSADSLIQLPICSIFAELYNDNPSQDFGAFAVAFESMPFEAQLICSDRSTLPVELSLSRVILPDDLFFLVVCRDIRVRKQQEAALIELKNSLEEQVETQRRQLAALLDASPLAMAYIVDRQLKQVNHAFLDLFDCNELACIDFTTRQFFLSEDQYQRTGQRMYKLLNAGQVATTELQLQTGRGQRMWCRLYGKALNPAVPGLGTIWLYQNFSAERAAEDALRRAKEQAEESDRSKTEFLANMSHELRTPMHAILGFAEMGKLRAEQAEQDRILQYFLRILASGNRLLSLLNDLLDLAKMEVGRMQYHMKPNDLSQCLQEACNEVALGADQQGIQIHLTCNPQPLIAVFDGMRLAQVIRNLLSNALKFSESGNTIRIAAAIHSASEGPEVSVAISDQGPGIPAAELDTIFDKFTQSSTTKNGAGGTGLGLAICREIITAHHGNIRADNLPAGGAIIRFTLPLNSRAELSEGIADGL